MQGVSSDYTTVLGSLPTPETLDVETEVLRHFYRYEKVDFSSLLRTVPKERTFNPNVMFMYFDFKEDPRKGKFVNPLDVDPAFDKAPKVCKLDFELKTLHVDDLISKKNLNAKKPLEHRLTVRAPVTLGAHRDWIDWIVCSAIDVFAAGSGRDKKLQAFVDGSSPTQVLAKQEVIQIEKGKVRLSHGLWGHTRKNVFLRVFEPLTKLLKSPLVAAVGLPALVPAMSEYVTKILGDYTAENALDDLWQTKSFDFSIAREAEGVFTLRPGLWTIIDADYVRDNQDLEGHKLDLKFGTFEILDKFDKQIEAAYLVNKIYLAPEETMPEERVH